jgi:hypothetical protein
MISDDDLRHALSDLRVADQAAAPAFRAVLERSRPATSINVRRVVALSLAASVMLVCTATIARVATRPRLEITPAVLDLSRWRPTTDALLESSSLAWYDAPTISDRIFPTNELPREQYP